MPEGPEVESVRRSLLPLLLGARVERASVSRLLLRIPTTTAKLRPIVGLVVGGMERKGKLLVVDLHDDDNRPIAGLFVRLGMSGQLLWVSDRNEKPRLHTHVRLALTGGPSQKEAELRYVDPRRFGSVVPFRSAAEREMELAQLGPDALLLKDPSVRAAVAVRLRQTSRSLKDALLDQRITSGLGNIYVAEALFSARLSPFGRGVDLRPAQAEALLLAAVAVLEDAVGHGGTSFSDYLDGLGQRGGHAPHLLVFGREGQPCRVCGAMVERQVQGQRSTFFCPACQRVGRAPAGKRRA